MKDILQTIYLVLLLFTGSCIKTDDFEIPEINIEQDNMVSNSSIKALKNAFDQSGEDIFTFSENDSSIIEAYVVSSDAGGNFFRSLVIQDKAENPVSGIEILIDLRSYFTKYNFGRKVFVKVAGLSITSIGGKYILGFNLRNEVEEIPRTLLDDFIIRSIETKEIIPQLISLSEISNKYIATYVELKNVQFKHDEVGKTYAGEPFDQFNGDRVLIQCADQISTILSTSTFSDFKSNIIPANKGNVKAIFTKDFFGESFVLVLNDPSTINFTDAERCDPDFLKCASKDMETEKLIFFENFQEINNTKDLEELGWTNKNTNLGNEKFKKRSSSGNVTMRISAFRTEENPLEVWLITPPINLDNTVDEILSFQTNATFDNGTILTVWVSSDYSNNIKEATWQQLNVKIAVGPRSGFTIQFVSSGKVSLDCLEGNVFIAFKYLGGDPGISTTYDIDNIKIEGN